MYGLLCNMILAEYLPSIETICSWVHCSAPTKPIWGNTCRRRTTPKCRLVTQAILIWQSTAWTIITWASKLIAEPIIPIFFRERLNNPDQPLLGREEIVTFSSPGVAQPVGQPASLRIAQLMHSVCLDRPQLCIRGSDRNEWKGIPRDACSVNLTFSQGEDFLTKCCAITSQIPGSNDFWSQICNLLLPQLEVSVWDSQLICQPQRFNRMASSHVVWKINIPLNASLCS